MSKYNFLYTCRFTLWCVWSEELTTIQTEFSKWKRKYQDSLWNFPYLYSRSTQTNTSSDLKLSASFKTRNCKYARSFTKMSGIFNLNQPAKNKSETNAFSTTAFPPLKNRSFPTKARTSSKFSTSSKRTMKFVMVL